LMAHGLETAIHYPIPIHLQPAAFSLGISKGYFPVTEKQSERILTLPVHQYLEKDDIKYVCEFINKFFKK
jgi:dTDP-4-amino-4,6-dideoxygalactose transaminase